mgnify:CR=1 FL=1
MDLCVHICTNGHVLQSKSWISGKEFCEKCGAEMLDKCPNCGIPIKEWDYGGVQYLGKPKYDRAAYCKNCGKAYPWTQIAIETATEIISEEDQLDSAQQEKLIASLPDIISETPKTQIATVRFKKALLSVGKFTADALREFVIDFGCEFAKSQLGI